MSKTTKKKYTFSLNGVNILHLNTTYGIKTTEPSVEEDVNLNKNTTKIVELDKVRGTPEVISFLDESKKLHTCYVSMVDFHSKMYVNLLRYHCFWCRHPFDTQPIGCPIRYVSNQAEKKYHSQISQDIYRIKENITSKKYQHIKQSDQISLKIGEYYETDGVFCSFNCCQAWINENKHNITYSMSSILLAKMYNTIMDTKTIIISPAPHWRLLEQYGGHLNIIKFRESFNKIDYKYHGITKQIPNFLPLGKLYEENIKF